MITPENFDLPRHGFLLPAAPAPPIRMLVKELRTERAYEGDDHPSATALSAICRAANFLPGNLYSILAELDAAPIKKLRSYKGILSPHSRFRHIQHLNVEAKIKNGYSRIGAVISLVEALPFEESKLLLSFRTGVIIAAPLDIADVSKMAESWMAGMADRILSLDFDSIVESICDDPEIVVLRYFAADNGKMETVALIFNDEHKTDAFAFLESLKIE